jgi:hypothetical protein
MPKAKRSSGASPQRRQSPRREAGGSRVGKSPPRPTLDGAADVQSARLPASSARPLRASRGRLALYHVLLLGVVFLFWYAMTEPGLIPPFYFDDPTRAKFFFGQPLEVLKRIWIWFSGGTIYLHLGVTLIETLLAFAIGTILGLVL